MKKKFIAKNKRKKVKLKLFIFVFIFIISIYLTYNYLEQTSIKLSDKEFINYILSDMTKLSDNSNIFNKIISYITNINYLDPKSIISNNYKGLVSSPKVIKTVKEEKIDTTPIIYIYNSHQTEEYATTSFAEYSINPTVMMADYIIQDIFNKNKLYTTVEEKSIKDVLNSNNWKYVYSYKASRTLMEKALMNNPKLTYFIDVHRDSLNKDKTTIEINGKNYAKTIFLIGLENNSYEENLAFTTKINDKMNRLYPGLSKGIYKKGGPGVNGVYNQDFSKNTILIEIGGNENTIDEVLNSSIAFSNCFMEVIKENEG